METFDHTPLVTGVRGACRGALRALWRIRLAIGWTGVALLLILAVAAYVRLRGVNWGLPYSYQNPDERIVLQRAFRVARGHPNPEWFYYPSLLFYVIGTVTWFVGEWFRPHAGGSYLAPVSFITDPTPYFLIGRLVVAAFGVAAVYLVYRIGREAFSRTVGLLAALFLAAEPLHVRYSHVAVTDVPASSLGLLALLLFLRAARLRSGRWLVAGALVAGLATGTKYNLGMLVLPAVIAAWFVYRDRSAGDRLRSFAAHAVRAVALPMVVAFVVSTPFALLDLPHFARDFYRQNRIMANGWLGFENVHNGYWYNLHVNLAGSLGVVLLVLGLAGLVLALVRRTRADVILVPFVIVYYLYVSSWHELADRYLLPIVPLLIILAVRLCAELARAPVVRRRAVAVGAATALLAGAILVPAHASIVYTRSLSGIDVRTVAKAWIETHLPYGSIVATEPYGPPLVPRRVVSFYRQAGVATPSYHIVRLPLPLPGAPDTRDRMHFLVERDVRYVVITSSIYDRVLAARTVYPEQVAFYEQLARHGRLMRTFTPGPGQHGPQIRLYRLPADLALGSSIR
jgi:hypothetical protein